MKLCTKGNIVSNWEMQYQPLPITYTERVKTPIDLAEQCCREVLHEDILKYLLNHNTLKILECGCGGARNSLYLALRGFEVACSDFSPEAIRLAQANFAAFGASGTFVLDDLMHSQLPPDSFDKRDFRNIISKSYREFPHFENNFSFREYARAFESGGNAVLRCEAQGVLLPLIYLPFRIGDILVRKFPETLMRLFKRSNRTESRLLHFLSPSFYLVCRKI